MGLPAEFGIGLDGAGTHPGPFTFPNGCMICEVEVDTDTGTVAVVKLSAVDDVGTVVNPLTLEGQLHGSTAQGLGETLLEQVVYERGSGTTDDGVVPGLRDAARRQHAGHRQWHSSGSDQAQSARVQRAGASPEMLARRPRSSTRSSTRFRHTRSPTCRCRQHRSGSGG